MTNNEVIKKLEAMKIFYNTGEIYDEDIEALNAAISVLETQTEQIICPHCGEEFMTEKGKEAIKADIKRVKQTAYRKGFGNGMEKTYNLFKNNKPDDTVSRKAIIDAFCDWCGLERGSKYCSKPCSEVNVVKEVPATDNADNDAVSKKAVLDAFCKGCNIKKDSELCPDPCTEIKIINSISAENSEKKTFSDTQPEQRKKGEWITTNDPDQPIYCSECDACPAWFVSSPSWITFWDKPSFCPNCGADMRGENHDK